MLRLLLPVATALLLTACTTATRETPAPFVEEEIAASMPDVIGLKKDAAVFAIKAINPWIRVTSERVYHAAADGLVIDSNPDAGGPLSTFKRVHLIVSRGPAPVWTPIPDVVNQSLASAEHSLASAGFKSTVTSGPTETEFRWIIEGCNSERKIPFVSAQKPMGDTAVPDAHKITVGLTTTYRYQYFSSSDPACFE